MIRKLMGFRFFVVLTLYLVLSVVILNSDSTASPDFPDEIMGIDLMQALDETITDIDSAFELLKSSEEGIQVQIDELQTRILQLAAEDAKLPPLPTGVGDAVMKAFGLAPSRQIGVIKKLLEEAIAKGEIAERLPSEDYVAFVAKDKARFGI